MDGPGANAGLAGALAGWVGALTGDPLLVLATLLGLITPPGGVLIYLTAAQAGAQVHHEVRELVPVIAALVLLLAALVLFPPLTLWLPGLFFG